MHMVVLSFISMTLLFAGDERFYTIRVLYRQTVFYVEFLTKKSAFYATPIAWTNIIPSVLAPDSDISDYYSILYKSITEFPPQLLNLSEIHSANNSIEFTPKDALIYSNARFDQFWLYVLFCKHFDVTFLSLGTSVNLDTSGHALPDLLEPQKTFLCPKLQNFALSVR